MFDDETSTQPIADKLKQIIHRAEPKGKRAAMAALQQFERCGWHSRAFDEANNKRLAIDDEGKLIYKGGDAITGITDILTHYIALAGCAEEYSDPMGIEAAARYLGITIDGVKKQVHRTGNLVPILEGHTLMFSKAMLDEYKKTRKLGRPTKETEE